MNKKGVVFTFMVWLLLINIIGQNTIIKEQQHIFQESISEISALIRVNNKLNNIFGNIVEMGGENKVFVQRILPFDYDIDGNRILIWQELPLRAGSVNSFFDAINSYVIFIEDVNYANSFDGIVADMNVAQNPEWGGDSSQLNFIITPQCLKYTIDLNNSLLEGGNCTEQFDITSVLRYDLNVGISGVFIEDFNSVVCDFSGYVGCPDMDFNISNPLPYFQFNFNDENCSLCIIDESLKTIKGHFNPLYDNNITISCIPQGEGICISTPIYIIVNEGMDVSRNGDRIDIAISTTFKNPIEGFEFEDLNVLVRDDFFNVSSRRVR